MRTHLFLLSACCLALFLPGCETLGLTDGDDVEVTSAPQGDMTPMGAEGDDYAPITNNAQGTGMLSQAPGVRPVPKFGTPNDRDLMIMTDKIAGSSVDLYDLDQRAPVGRPSPSGFYGQGVPAAADSSVTVFPMDGGPSSMYPSPFVQGQMQPSSMPMQQAGGRASPHLGHGYSPTQVFFKHGSSRLGGGDRQILSQAAEQAKFSPVDRVSVEGHASSRAQSGDPVRDKVLNLKESMNRAYEVSKTLIEDGVPAEKIKTVGWGDTRPAGDESYSRRVDVVTGATQ